MGKKAKAKTKTRRVDPMTRALDGLELQMVIRKPILLTAGDMPAIKAALRAAGLKVVPIAKHRKARG